MGYGLAGPLIQSQALANVDAGVHFVNQLRRHHTGCMMNAESWRSRWRFADAVVALAPKRALDQVTIGIADIRAGVDKRDVERDRDG